VGWEECTITLTVIKSVSPVRLVFGYLGGAEEDVGDFTTGVHTITKTGLIQDAECMFKALPSNGESARLCFTTLGAKPSPPDFFTPFYQQFDEVSFFWAGGQFQAANRAMK